MSGSSKIREAPASALPSAGRGVVTQAQLRRLVFERDHGVCKSCGRDMVAARADYQREISDEFSRHFRRQAEVGSEDAWAHRGNLKGIRTKWAARFGMTLADVQRLEWFDCHHIKPLADGGENVPENAETLCLADHRAASKVHAGQRSRRPAKRLARIGVDRAGRTKVWT
jgi:5-methylcytosine-specific restriction endonuclease McrA